MGTPWSVSFDSDTVAFAGRVGTVEEACQVIQVIAAFATCLSAQWDRSGEADETRRGSAAGESPVDGEAGDAPAPLTPSNPEIPNG